MIEIDGSMGEGGGQVLRSSLSLSLCTGKPFCITNIRAGRKRPGLLRQHLTAVNAAAEVGQAKVMGAELKSQELTFYPGEIKGGSYRFAVGTAGSTTLVLQTILMPLCFADTVSEVVIEGGTHNSKAPPFHYLGQVYIPLLNKMGANVSLSLERYGFYPAGGGRIKAVVIPTHQLTGLVLNERGKEKSMKAEVIISSLPGHIAQRELEVASKKLAIDEECLQISEIASDQVPGNVFMVTMENEMVTEMFTGFGEKGKSAEQVAKRTVDECKAYRRAGVPVGEHLADQLLLPLALSNAGSRFRTLRPSLHTMTNIETIKAFIDIEISCEMVDGKTWEIVVYKEQNSVTA